MGVPLSGTPLAGEFNALSQILKQFAWFIYKMLRTSLLQIGAAAETPGAENIVQVGVGGRFDIHLTITDIEDFVQGQAGDAQGLFNGVCARGEGVYDGIIYDAGSGLQGTARFLAFYGRPADLGIEMRYKKLGAVVKLIGGHRQGQAAALQFFKQLRHPLVGTGLAGQIGAVILKVDITGRIYKGLVGGLFGWEGALDKHPAAVAHLLLVVFQIPGREAQLGQHLVAGAAYAANGIQHGAVKVKNDEFLHRVPSVCRKNSNFTAMNPKTLISPEELSEGSSARRILISLDGGVISNPLRRLPDPVSFQLRQGECIAVVGPVGSGKSTLLKMITGGFYLREGTLRLDLDDESYRAIRFVEFDNAYSTTETQYYHQQRWQAFEREASPLAGELLGVAAGENTEGMPGGTCQDKLSWQQRLFEILNIGPLLGKEIITLSSGELRRFSIARALLQRPQVLMLESPFIGLDPPTRQVLCDLLEQVLNTLGISIIMTLTDPDRIPSVVTHAYYMDHGRLSAKMPASQPNNPRLSSSDTKAEEDLHETDKFSRVAKQFFHEAEAFEKVVEMRNINISYGERQIFRDLNWTVHSGERWNVTGPNGSGKSTLLSLVNADNPRAYSLDITLFDRRRGTGESIWDIKRHIGYLSSEMHSSFRENLPVLDIVRSGMDYGCHIDDEALLQWLRLFGAEHLAQRSYLTLSSGEQRYILLIRAFVKDPDLLILDEPFQGLDPALRHRAAAVINAFCSAKSKTLIFVTHYLDEVPGVVTHTLQL